MISFLLRKTAYSLFVILGIITIVFILFNVIPADPAKMMLGERDDARQLERIRKKYNLDKPLLSRYFLYLNDLSVISIYNENGSFLVYNEDDNNHLNKMLNLDHQVYYYHLDALNDS